MTCLSVVANAQNFEPKWIGQVMLLSIGTDTVAMQAEKANCQFTTKASAGRIIAGIGNVKQKVEIKGGKSPVKVSPYSPVILVVRSENNEIDPSTFIQIIQFETSRKKRTAELANLNWLDNYYEGNMRLIPFEADSYGKSSYILTLSPGIGEYGVRVLNPKNLDEKIPIFYCFGVYDPTEPAESVSDKLIPGEFYEYSEILYPVYQDVDGKKYIMIDKNTKRYCE